MTGSLRFAGGDDDALRCSMCGALAAGPCARCRRPVCADCSELTEGGASTWAICTECARQGGRSLRRAWMGLVAWIAGPILLLLAVVVLLRSCR